MKLKLFLMIFASVFSLMVGTAWTAEDKPQVHGTARADVIYNPQTGKTDLGSFFVGSLGFSDFTVKGEFFRRYPFDYVTGSVLWGSAVKFGPKYYTNSVGDRSLGGEFSASFVTPLETNTAVSFAYLPTVSGGEDITEAFFQVMKNFGEFDAGGHVFYQESNLQVRGKLVWGDWYAMPSLHLREDKPLYEFSINNQ